MAVDLLPYPASIGSTEASKDVVASFRLIDRGLSGRRAQEEGEATRRARQLQR
jgi:hypothetical protein